MNLPRELRRGEDWLLVELSVCWESADCEVLPCRHSETSSRSCWGARSWFTAGAIFLPHSIANRAASASPEGCCSWEFLLLFFCHVKELLSIKLKCIIIRYKLIAPFCSKHWSLAPKHRENKENFRVGQCCQLSLEPRAHFVHQGTSPAYSLGLRCSFQVQHKWMQWQRFGSHQKARNFIVFSVQTLFRKKKKKK